MPPPVTLMPDPAPEDRVHHDARASESFPDAAREFAQHHDGRGTRRSETNARTSASRHLQNPALEADRLRAMHTPKPNARTSSRRSLVLPGTEVVLEAPRLSDVVDYGLKGAGAIVAANCAKNPKACTAYVEDFAEKLRDPKLMRKAMQQSERGHLMTPDKDFARERNLARQLQHASSNAERARLARRLAE